MAEIGYGNVPVENKKRSEHLMLNLETQSHVVVFELHLYHCPKKFMVTLVKIKNRLNIGRGHL